jgi:hypothetical protein
MFDFPISPLQLLVPTNLTSSRSLLLLLLLIRHMPSTRARQFQQIKPENKAIDQLDLPLRSWPKKKNQILFEHLYVLFFLLALKYRIV